ncbi:peptidoglycan DD-metalloendopeptidase family protein [Candidatus Kaiserbacteria bacterium]|nr:peptidoglycan DD-metalloendopeptidase family protein [Candidatus Kaiserbacteria bacterium]
MTGERIHIFTHIRTLCILAVFAVGWISIAPPNASAQSIEEIQKQISDYGAKIDELEKDIARYETELTHIGGEKRTLESTVSELNLSRKKLLTNIQITQNRIYSTTLQIQELSRDITDKSGRIENNTDAVSLALRNINEMESQSMIEVVLGHDNLNEFWDQLETLQRFQIVVRDELRDLIKLKKDLETTKTSSERKKIELTNYNTELAGQKVVLEGTLSEQNILLNKTVQKESEYQKLLNEKIAAREQFENDLLELESQLRIAIDPNSIPPYGSGILRFPFSDSYMQGCKAFNGQLKNIYCITQYFGNTPFATQNPQIYRGAGHNGVDFRASVGTKVQVALTGTVTGTGNTDTQRGCYSYGKWVLVKHNNGLTTLYAHLSHISVNLGQNVSTGDVIGFSGNTGYSTGPHLHFTVYATQGVRIERFTKSVNCRNVEIPIAPLDAYLNPLSYL